MQQRLTGIFNRRHKNRDDGFSLVELVVAMFIIGGVLLSLVTLQTKAMVSIAQAKERQQATAIANRVMEELRSLPWQVLSNGSAAESIPADDPYVTSGNLTIDGEPISNEPLALRGPANDSVRSVFEASPLYGDGGSNVTSHYDAAQGREFLVRSYVTEPNGSHAPLNLVVVVEWDLNSSSETRRVVAKSTIFNTESGCGSAETLPYATACQDFYTATVTSHGASISILGNTEDGSTSPNSPEILLGSDTAMVSVAGPGASVSIDSAQATSVNASGITGSLRGTDTSEIAIRNDDGESTASRVSNSVTSSDPRSLNGNASHSFGAPFNIPGSDATLRITTGTRSVQSTATTTEGCETWAAGEQPCGWARASTSTADRVEIVIDSEKILLAEVIQNQPKVIAARFPGGGSAPAGFDLCTSITGSGCAQSHFDQGAVDINIPAVAQVRQSAEGGTSLGTDTADRRLTAKRNGDYSTEWPGAVNGSIRDEPLAISSDDSFEVFSNDNVIINATARIRTDEVRVEEDSPDPECRTAACVQRVEIPSTEISVTYEVIIGSQVSEFTVTISGGESRAAVNYTASPEAWSED